MKYIRYFSMLCAIFCAFGLCIGASAVEVESGSTYCFGAGDFSDDMFRYAKQFAESDIVVVAAPYWDMSFPAMLKIYFEAVSVQGVTFRYSEDGMPVGLTNVKKVIYVTTAGGPVGDFNLGFDYVRSLCGMLYGIPEVVCHKAEFLDIIGADVDAILRRTMDEIDREYEEENK